MCACASARSAESGARRTDPEPLPDDHPLWGAPGVLSITPRAEIWPTARQWLRSAPRTVTLAYKWLAAEPKR